MPKIAPNTLISIKLHQNYNCNTSKKKFGGEKKILYICID